LRRTVLITLGLLLLTVAAYFQSADLEFVNFDDDLHVYENDFVRTGLTLRNIKWAFGIHGPSQWHPLSWLSHQLDCELFGLNPAGHHLSNLSLHLANVALLFLTLKTMTGRDWPSAFIAAVFAVHPLNVESVAWVSERRNVLSGLFWMLTLLAYAKYVFRESRKRYLIVLILFCLGLMSKPILVTLPCVLLLLDIWPFRRFQPIPEKTSSAFNSELPRGSQHTLSFLVIEKLPFFVLSAISSYLTVLCQQSAQVVISTESIPVSSRIANALIAYSLYLKKFFWPSDLAIFYPHPLLFGDNTPSVLIGPAIFSACIVLGISVFSVISLRRRPYLFVGWFWFLGTLVPMIGIVQVGSQQMADRYTYVPQIGLLIALTWLFLHQNLPKRTVWFFSSMVLFLLACTTWVQVGYWRNSITLFERTLLVTENNSYAHNNLGRAYSDSGRIIEAVEQYRAALKVSPDYALAHYNLGIAFHDLNQPHLARHHFEQAILFNSHYPAAHLRFGALLGQRGLLNEAIEQFRLAVDLDPNYEFGHLNLAIALSRTGEINDALQHFQIVLKVNSGNTQAHFGMALIMAEKAEWQLAEKHLHRVLELNPSMEEARNELGKVYLSQEKRQKAIQQFQKALGLNPNFFEAKQNLEQVKSDE